LSFFGACRPGSPSFAGSSWRERDTLKKRREAFPMASGSTRDPVVEKGMEIFERMGGERPSVFDRKSLSGRIMEAAMKDPDRKVRLFRFVDVFPTLTTSDLVTEHIREYFLDESAALPPL
jgi:RHH-type proline utilization regulon transcriptional repressor/proline dehydrogenase/delta 1-pyrroline-5-carboxylate dehydrogenase